MNSCGRAIALLLPSLALCASAFAGEVIRSLASDPPGASVPADERARLACVETLQREVSMVFGRMGLIVGKKEKENFIQALITEFGRRGGVTAKAFGPNTLYIGAGKNAYVTGHYYSPGKTVIFHHHMRVNSNDCWTRPLFYDELTALNDKGRMTYGYSYEADSLPKNSDRVSVHDGECHAQFAIQAIQTFVASENLCSEYLELLR